MSHRQRRLDGTTAPRTFAEFRDYAYNEWRDHYEMNPTWGPKEYKALKRLHESCKDQAWLVWDLFLMQRGEFYRGHPPAKCFSERDRFRSHAPQKPKPNSRGYTDDEREAILTRLGLRKQQQKEYEDEVQRRRRRILEEGEKPSITKEMLAELKASLKRRST